MTSPAPADAILVVDDCAGVCEVIHILLSRAGYHVITATNGTEALRLARNTPAIDLLLCNLEMPGMHGEEVAGRFAELHPWTPVVFLSSFPSLRADADGDEFLPKPFTVGELRDTVRRALRSRESFAKSAQAV